MAQIIRANTIGTLASSYTVDQARRQLGKLQDRFRVLSSMQEAHGISRLTAGAHSQTAIRELLAFTEPLPIPVVTARLIAVKVKDKTGKIKEAKEKDDSEYTSAEQNKDKRSRKKYDAEALSKLKELGRTMGEATAPSSAKKDTDKEAAVDTAALVPAIADKLNKLLNYVTNYQDTVDDDDETPFKDHVTKTVALVNGLKLAALSNKSAEQDPMQEAQNNFAAALKATKTLGALEKAISSGVNNIKKVVKDKVKVDLDTALKMNTTAGKEGSAKKESTKTTQRTPKQESKPAAPKKNAKKIKAVELAGMMSAIRSFEPMEVDDIPEVLEMAEERLDALAKLFTGLPDLVKHFQEAKDHLGDATGSTDEYMEAVELFEVRTNAALGDAFKNGEMEFVKDGGGKALSLDSQKMQDVSAFISKIQNGSLDEEDEAFKSNLSKAEKSLTSLASSLPAATGSKKLVDDVLAKVKKLTKPGADLDLEHAASVLQMAVSALAETFNTLIDTAGYTGTKTSGPSAGASAEDEVLPGEDDAGDDSAGDDDAEFGETPSPKPKTKAESKKPAAPVDDESEFDPTPKVTNEEDEFDPLPKPTATSKKTENKPAATKKKDKPAVTPPATSSAAPKKGTPEFEDLMEDAQHWATQLHGLTKLKKKLSSVSLRKIMQVHVANLVNLIPSLKPLFDKFTSTISENDSLDDKGLRQLLGTLVDQVDNHIGDVETGDIGIDEAGSEEALDNPDNEFDSDAPNNIATDGDDDASAFDPTPSTGSDEAGSADVAEEEPTQVADEGTGSAEPDNSYVAPEEGEDAGNSGSPETPDTDNGSDRPFEVLDTSGTGSPVIKNNEGKKRPSGKVQDMPQVKIKLDPQVKKEISKHRNIAAELTKLFHDLQAVQTRVNTALSQTLDRKQIDNISNFISKFGLQVRSSLLKSTIAIREMTQAHIPPAFSNTARNLYNLVVKAIPTERIPVLHTFMFMDYDDPTQQDANNPDHGDLCFTACIPLARPQDKKGRTIPKLFVYLTFKTKAHKMYMCTSKELLPLDDELFRAPFTNAKGMKTALDRLLIMDNFHSDIGNVPLSSVFGKKVGTEGAIDMISRLSINGFLPISGIAQDGDELVIALSPKLGEGEDEQVEAAMNRLELALKTKVPKRLRINKAYKFVTSTIESDVEVYADNADNKKTETKPGQSVPHYEIRMSFRAVPGEEDITEADLSFLRDRFAQLSQDAVRKMVRVANDS